jgi:PKD repeat protein
VDGQIVSTTINFGDGTIVNAASATHTYQSAGTFTIMATLTDDRGATSSSTASVTATAANQSPVVVMNVSTGASLGVTVSLSSSYDPDGSIASGTIDFGDGTTVNGTAASHTYVTGGTYTIKGSVTDNRGAVA